MMGVMVYEFTVAIIVCRQYKDAWNAYVVNALKTFSKRHCSSYILLTR